jgi:ribosomal protein S18 acetylase RimI-like enzyme
MSTRTAVTVRGGTPDALAAVAALERELFGRDAWSATLLAPLLSQSAGSCLVAELDDTVVGHVIACAAGDVVDLQRLGVRAQHRRRGLARRLLAEVLAEVRVADRRVLVEVNADNHGALAFYAAEDFTEIDRRPHYYWDGSDAIVMQGRGVAR